MKNMIKKVFLSILALIVSISAAVLGMYMVFLAEMIFGYRLLFAAVFMFNPIMTGFLIANMFKKPEAQPAKEPKESGRRKKRREDDSDTDEQPVYTPPVSQPSSYVPQTGQQSLYTAPVQQQFTNTAPAITPDPLNAEPAADISFDDGSFSETAETNPNGYDLPGSQTFTNSGDDVKDGGGADAELSKKDVKSRLKFWEKSKDLTE